MSRSKLSMLSSSTIHLELDESYSTQQTTVTIDDANKSSKGSANDDTTNLPHLHNSYENTVAQSSFREELISHFERRLSDLGPRSKYPYLQQIDTQHDGHSTDSPESTSHSEEVLTRLSKEKRRGTWWKYYATSKAEKTEPGQSGTDHDDVSKRTD